MVTKETISSALMAWQTFTYITRCESFSDFRLKELEEHFSPMSEFLEGGITKDDDYIIIHYEFKNKEQV